MKMFIASLFLFLNSFLTAFAHEGEEEITNLAEADWLGPIIAIVLIVFTITVARIIKKRSKKIISND